MRKRCTERCVEWRKFPWEADTEWNCEKIHDNSGGDKCFRVERRFFGTFTSLYTTIRTIRNNHTSMWWCGVTDRFPWRVTAMFSNWSSQAFSGDILALRGQGRTLLCICAHQFDRCRVENMLAVNLDYWKLFWSIYVAISLRARRFI